MRYPIDFNGNRVPPHTQGHPVLLSNMLGYGAYRLIATDQPRKTFGDAFLDV